MSVNWLWKDKVGEIIYYDQKEKQSWKLEMFTGNVMCCFIYRFEQINEETGKKEKMYNFFTWLNDLKHAKKCLKDDKPLEHLPLGNHKVKKVKIKVTKFKKWFSNEMLELARLFAEKGYKVEIY